MQHLFALLTLTLTAALLLPTTSATAEQAGGVVNIYSSRHYDSDDKLFTQFTEATGIKINLIEGKADELLARIKREGDLSPADLFITVDAGRLHLAVEAGVLQPISSPTLNDRIPENLRHPQGLWFGLSQRVRCIFLSNTVEPDYVTTYAELADPRLDRGLLIRSSSNIYNQSLLASLIANQGTSATQAWANGVVNNMARRPQGGDTDQLRALAAGEGEVAVANHYYYARMIAGSSASDKMAASKIRIVFPDQNGRGAHVNVSGAGVLKTASNKANAVKFLEFMTTPQAQTLWALENHEYPVIEGLPLTPVLQSFGMFKPDTLNASQLGNNNAEGKRVMDRAGWR